MPIFVKLLVFRFQNSIDIYWFCILQYTLYIYLFITVQTEKPIPLKIPKKHEIYIYIEQQYKTNIFMKTNNIFANFSSKFYLWFVPETWQPISKQHHSRSGQFQRFLEMFLSLENFRIWNMKNTCHKFEYKNIFFKESYRVCYTLYI